MLKKFESFTFFLKKYLSNKINQVLLLLIWVEVVGVIAFLFLNISEIF